MAAGIFAASIWTWNAAKARAAASVVNAAKRSVGAASVAAYRVAAAVVRVKAPHARQISRGVEALRGVIAANAAGGAIRRVDAFDAGVAIVVQTQRRV